MKVTIDLDLSELEQKIASLQAAVVSQAGRLDTVEQRASKLELANLPKVVDPSSLGGLTPVYVAPTKEYLAGSQLRHEVYPYVPLTLDWAKAPITPENTDFSLVGSSLVGQTSSISQENKDLLADKVFNLWKPWFQVLRTRTASAQDELAVGDPNAAIGLGNGRLYYYDGTPDLKLINQSRRITVSGFWPRSAEVEKIIDMPGNVRIEGDLTIVSPPSDGSYSVFGTVTPDTFVEEDVARNVKGFLLALDIELAALNPSNFFNANSVNLGVRLGLGVAPFGSDPAKDFLPMRGYPTVGSGPLSAPSQGRRTVIFHTLTADQISSINLPF